MWLDKKGVMNTVALPDPGDAVAPTFVAGLRRLRDSSGEDLEEVLDELEDEIFDSMWEYDELTEGRYVGEPPPSILLMESPDSVEALVRLIRDVDSRWKLDALMIAQDLISEI